MAGKPLNRLELRRQSDAAEPLDPMEDESEEIVEDLDDDTLKAIANSSVPDDYAALDKIVKDWRP